MQQAVYREEKPITSYEDPPEESNDVWADLQLQYLWQGVQPSWQQEEAWSGPQLQLDLWSMRSVFQQTGQPSTPSCPSWETRGQAETTDEETSSTWTRTRDEAATFRDTTTQNSHGESCWTRRVARGSRDQRPVPEALEVHPDRGSDRQLHPGPVQLYPAWDDSIHLSRDSTVPVQTADHSIQDQHVFWFYRTAHRDWNVAVLSCQPEQRQILRDATPHQNRRRLGGVQPTRHTRVHPATETRYQVGRSSADQRDLLPMQVDPTSQWCQSRLTRLFPAKPRLGVFS